MLRRLLVQDGMEHRFLDVGFDGYLRKPLQATMLQELLKTVKAKR